MTRLWRVLTSLRTALGLMGLLGVLLLTNIVVPQRALMGDDAFDRLTAQGGATHYLLVTLGLGSIPTHPLFLGALGLFFLCLGCSLVERLRPVLRRSSARRLTPETAAAWLRRPGALHSDLPAGWCQRAAVAVLRASGYRTSKVGEGLLWGVRNPAAPLGFALFHASFFLLCAGGTLLYGTRFAATATVIEGQPWQGRYGRIVRDAPWSRRPQLAFTASEIDWRNERGAPVHLGARIRFLHAGRSAEQAARVNAPATWGHSTVLLQSVGLALDLWLQDEDGYTLARVLAPAVKTGDELSLVPLADSRYVVVALPIAPEAFPPRATLADTALHLQVRRQGGPGTPLFDGTLLPGGSVELGTDRLILQDVRPWVGVLVVSERGGGLLIAGFVLGVIGLIWRMLWYRREVLVAWGGARLTLVGRSEHYPLRFQEELAGLLRLLRAEGGATEPTVGEARDRSASEASDE